MKHFIVDDFVSAEATEAMLDEVVRLQPHLQKPRPKVSPRGLFGPSPYGEGRRYFECSLDHVYHDQRKHSAILGQMNRQVFSPEMLAAYTASGDLLYSYLLPRVNFDQTHLSAYGDGHHSHKHVDPAPSFLTALLMLCSTPKAFEGGNLELHWSPQHVDRIEFRSRRLVLFPSGITHCITDMHMPEETDFRHWLFVVKYWPQYRERVVAAQ